MRLGGRRAGSLLDQDYTTKKAAYLNGKKTAYVKACRALRRACEKETKRYNKYLKKPCESTKEAYDAAKEDKLTAEKAERDALRALLDKTNLWYAKQRKEG